MKVTILLLLLTLFPQVSFGEQPKKKPLSKEQIEKLENLQKAIDSIEDMEATMKRRSQEKFSSCLKAIGSNSFCNCIREKTPVGITFQQYVGLLSLSDEEIKKASSGDKENKKIIETTLQAREMCVGNY